ncbi:FAD/FMN-dependent dehydrogenase [Candidatus Methanoperedens nitroreducens]|uniref:FAD/FMN-dependent dehydrogenase n=1 Tax=Candidatus Methanoperedens nitratireducens TaxID=1392998 RepID=A0A062V6R2_9EURY|nr:FAD-binding oxidoreductase [Candidatus Methanoperedens nitroreducens]KCZ71095.1 FAD/FMN-dependent dehydrogenase [Candidatus Methanoperedens nitroreducens]MDJ1421529.1 FAD-binding oxidoreductase [Candidatus Methanoperedens sp.]
MVKIDEETIQKFKESMRGELIRPGDAGYDDARKIWNGMIDKHPALIARCTGAVDIINAVNFARSSKLLVAVRGGGHNVAGNAVCDGGLVIDLSRMKSIRIDPASRTARAEPGVTWGELDRETQAFGLALPGGMVSTTGIAGLTLGGGYGWLTRKYGMTIDNLLSADVVTADGQFLVASKTENSDLFWGIRGGGGNFGIVTSFEFRLHPVGPTILGGILLHPLAKAKEVLQFYREYMTTAPVELTVAADLATAPKAPHLPEHIQGTPVLVLAICYVGSIEEGKRIIQPLRTFGSPEVDLVGPVPYTALQKMLDAAYPPGWQYYWKSEYVKDLSDDVIDILVDYAANRPSQRSDILFEYLLGAVNQIGDDETPFSHRNAPFVVALGSMWYDRLEDEENIKWAKDLWNALQPFTTGGVYVNFLMTEGTDRVMAAYGKEKYERLVALKNKYDPTNFFSLNQNIKPRK